MNERSGSEMQRIVQKFSILYLSEGEQTKVYRSLGEVPEDVRRRLSRLARGSRVETLLIANERGRQLLETGDLSNNSKPGRTLRLTRGTKWAVALLLAAAVGALMTLVLHFE